jgi:hypothetical protein
MKYTMKNKIRNLVLRAFGLPTVQEIASIQREINIRRIEVAEAYNRMHDYREKWNKVREDWIASRKATHGPWIAKKDGKGFYRKWRYPNCLAVYQTESIKTKPEDWK